MSAACARAPRTLRPSSVSAWPASRRLPRSALGGVVFGAQAKRLPNTCYFALTGIDGETLVGKLDRAGFAVASGAACSSANPEPSHVLLAMGVESRLVRGGGR